VRVAALYDIHGNLPALEAVLAEVAAENVDTIVFGGDVASGPMPAETLQRMRKVDARCVMGNADRQMVEDFDAGRDPDDAESQLDRALWWAARQITVAQRDYLAGFEATVSIDVDGLGPVLFCHGSPRSDEERLTRITPADRAAETLEGVAAQIVVCGHTHQQFDRPIGERRLLNAGSVGMPYEGDAAAFWLLLGPDPELRRTEYDVAAAADRMRAAGMPDVDEVVLNEALLEPVDPDWVAQYFESGVPPADQP
jgi:predicted phosphodiesterase